MERLQNRGPGHGLAIGNIRAAKANGPVAGVARPNDVMIAGQTIQCLFEPLQSLRIVNIGVAVKGYEYFIASARTVGAPREGIQHQISGHIYPGVTCVKPLLAKLP